MEEPRSFLRDNILQSAMTAEPKAGMKTNNILSDNVP